MSTTTREKAQKFMRQVLNRSITAELGFDLTEAANFADFISSEKDLEIARLDKALREAMMLCGTVRIVYRPELGLDMRAQIEKVEELGFAALGISVAALSKEKA